jgi:hypothetical protein
VIILLSLIFEIFNLIFSDWVSFLVYPNLFGNKSFVVVVVVVVSILFTSPSKIIIILCNL